MNKPVCLLVIVFSLLFFPIILLGQLTIQQKAALDIYIESTPALSKYDKGIREKVFDDPAISAEVKTCWVHLKKYAALERSRKMQDLSEMYSELGQGVPESRDKFLPDFNKLDYKNTMTILPGNTLNIDATKHTALLKHYNAGRHDRLNPENDFGSMIIQYPELVENLRKAANADNKKVTDDLLNLWLEMNYYQQMRLDAVRQITAEEKNVQMLLEGCLPSLPKKLEYALAKEDNTPQNWNGVFANENLSLKFERRNNFAFASSDKRLGSAAETAQWDLTVTGSKADGRWTVMYNDDDKIITRAGSVKVKLEGDIMEFEMIGDDWKIEWKPNVKPYDTETALTTKGIKMNGKLKRKY